MRSLGIDPGYGRVGWGVIENDSRLTCIAYGCIDTNPKAPFGARLARIEREIDELLDVYGPDVAGVEKLFFGRNTTTAMQVAEARGVILLTLHKDGLPLFEPTPNQVKAQVASARAGKKMVQRWVKNALGLKILPKPDDAADALAVAMYAEAQYRRARLVEEAE